MKHRLLGVATSVAMALPMLMAFSTPPVAAAACTVTAKLSPGAVSSQVPCLEQRLIDLGYTGIGTPDNTYGSASVSAVKWFQSTRGLYTDGIVTSVVGRELGLRGPLPTAPTTPRVTVIGDSTSAAMRWYDEANNVTNIYDVMGGDNDLLWSIESCRRLVNPSCVGRTDPGTGNKWIPVSVLPLMRTTLKGRLGQALVIMAGYDDMSIAGAIDPIMAEATAQGVSKVFWLNYRTTNVYHYGGYYAEHNNALEAAKVRWPNLVVVDWNGYTRAQPQATQNAWLESDGIHLTRTGATALANLLKVVIDGSGVARCVAASASAGSPDPTTGTPPAPPSTANGFTPQSPVRVLDTRQVQYGGAKVGAGNTLAVDLDAALPAGATAATLTVTAVSPCQQGFLTVFACGVRPNTSNLNFVAMRNTAGLAISLVTDRQVCIYSSAATDLVVDVVGSFGTGGDMFHPTGPTRWVDTRGNAAVLPITGRLADGAQLDVPIADQNAVPHSATAVWLNLTAVGALGTTVLEAYPGPCGSPPVASSVNVLSGRTAAAAVLVALGTNGGVCVKSVTGSAHLVIDVAGWFGGPATGGLLFHLSTPARPVDTRGGAFPAAGVPVPTPLSQVSVLNVAAVSPQAAGFVTVAPCGATGASSLLNTTAAENTANLTAVAPGDGGNACLTPSMPSHLIADLVGTFEPAPG